MPVTITTPTATLEEPGNINVIVGRNGAGKSRFLRDMRASLRNNLVEYNTWYVSPERGGSFSNEANIDQNVATNEQWLYNIRNKNQSSDFKKSSASLLRQLEIAWGRRLDSDRVLRDTSKTFLTEYIGKINDLLLNIRMINSPNNYGFAFETYAGERIESEDISSGESEAVSLGTEILHFISTIDESKTNVLMLDEPDVHLHPDLQVRLAKFIINQLDELSDTTREKVVVIVTTHSTSLSCALAGSDYTKIGTKSFGSNVVRPRLSNARFQQTATFFAHPLSQVIAEEPLFIIEGDDDARVLQQAARSSNGRIKAFPCVADSVDQMAPLEQFCNEVLEALYDNPVAYSLRDGDGTRGTLAPEGCVQRFRLQCYAIENLLLTDEFLQSMGSNWGDFQMRATTWIATRSQDDPQATSLNTIIQAADRCRDRRVKDARTVICAILGSTKPWEFLLGQAIATLPNPLPTTNNADSMIDYIGIPVLQAVGFSVAPPPANPGE